MSSKMDGLRAMREAKFAANAKRTASSGGAAKAASPAPVAPAPARKAPARKAAPAEATPTEAAGTEALCGHRNMSGRTCTREAGHAAKSHRYS